MKHFQSKKVFVTGGTGLIGSHLLFELLKKGYLPIALYRKQSILSKIKKTISYYHSDAEDLFSIIEWIEGDINDAYSYKDAISKAEYVFHCAGKISSNKKHINELHQTNVMGTENIAQTCLKTNKKMCYTSSIAVFDKNKNKDEITEKTSNIHINKDKIRPYSFSKYDAEREVWKAIDKGLEAVIINLSVVIGPGNWEGGFGKIISNIDKRMPFYTSGGTGFVDVRDVVKIMIQLMEKDIYGKAFIVSSENRSYKEVFEIIYKNLHKPKPFIKIPKMVLRVIMATNLSKYITFETYKAAYGKSLYQNKEIVKSLNYQFLSVEQSIKDSCKLFLKEKKDEIL